MSYRQYTPMRSNNGNGSTKSRPPRAQRMTKTIEVTLEDLYNGAKRTMAHQARAECRACRGSEQYCVCEQCNGQGCEVCCNNGYIDVPCNDCNGTRTILHKKNETVRIRKGMRHGEEIPLEGFQVPNMRPYNLIYKLKLVDHPVFKRQDDDLHMTIRLKYVEALCGFAKVITTLDNRELVIRSPEGHVIQENEEKYIPGEGMPKYGNEQEKGILWLKFKIYQSDIDLTRIRNLAEYLPRPPQLVVPANAVQREMVNVELPYAKSSNNQKQVEGEDNHYEWPDAQERHESDHSDSHYQQDGYNHIK